MPFLVTIDVGRIVLDGVGEQAPSLGRTAHEGLESVLDRPA